MISFENDYNVGAHPAILQALIDTNLTQASGYGSDPWTARAAEKIRTACQRPDAQVEFIVGGTQTNSIIISTMLQEYEGVIAAQTGHVSQHEAGAIEYTGHKVIELPQTNGKLSAETVDRAVTTFYGDGNHEHMVFPGMVYISHPTEYGTLYSKEELTALYSVCQKHHLPLFVDGARLGYGLMSRQSTITLAELAQLCDVFYIGGTKVGALCGEAVVFCHGNCPSHFVNRIKKRGALLAKGRLLGVQFDTLFTDNLYLNISKNAIDRAEELKAVFHEKGYSFYLESPTNQQFIILENAQMEQLRQKLVFSFWEQYDETHTVVRFATSWATTPQDIQTLRTLL